MKNIRISNQHGMALTQMLLFMVVMGAFVAGTLEAVSVFEKSTRGILERADAAAMCEDIKINKFNAEVCRQTLIRSGFLPGTNSTASLTYEDGASVFGSSESNYVGTPQATAQVKGETTPFLSGTATQTFTLRNGGETAECTFSNRAAGTWRDSKIICTNAGGVFEANIPNVARSPTEAATVVAIGRPVFRNQYDLSLRQIDGNAYGENNLSITDLSGAVKVATVSGNNAPVDFVISIPFKKTVSGAKTSNATSKQLWCMKTEFPSAA